MICMMKLFLVGKSQLDQISCNSNADLLYPAYIHALYTVCASDLQKYNQSYLLTFNYFS
jgi:hypothetical protein